MQEKPMKTPGMRKEDSYTGARVGVSALIENDGWRRTSHEMEEGDSTSIARLRRRRKGNLIRRSSRKGGRWLPDCSISGGPVNPGGGTTELAYAIGCTSCRTGAAGS